MEQKYINACLVGDTDTIKQMIKIESKRFRSNELLSKCLNVACVYGHSEIVRTILTSSKYLRENYYHTCPNLLECVCKGANNEVMNTVAELHMFPSLLSTVILNKIWQEGLMYACKEGNMEFIKNCLSKTLCDISTNFWNSCLDNACESGNIEVVNFVIDKGVSMYGQRLRSACKGGNIEVVKLMIQKGSNDWNEGLKMACSIGDINIAKLIIKHGGVDDWNIALCYACGGGHIDIIDFLITKGANDYSGSLAFACSGGHTNVVKFLFGRIDAGVGVEVGVDVNINIWLSHACGQGHMEIVKILIDRGANNFYHGLVNACYGRHIDIVKLLLLTLDATDINNALYMVTKNVHNFVSMEPIEKDIVWLLINNGANNFYCLEQTTDFQLYCLYSAYKQLSCSKDTKYLALLQEYPPYVLFVGCKNKYTVNNSPNCCLKRLPVELFRLLFEY